ncbi:MAG: adenylosuccinate lyase, partial [Gammaproteobacteria bacterium]|nr:adenylosuccinate lyase [Gammaproteobacteria bacterium]
MSTAIPLTELTAIAPADGRYGRQLHALRDVCSEFGLMRFRVRAELAWLGQLARDGVLPPLAQLDDSRIDRLDEIATGFSLDDAARIKEIEATTNHDVKAVEYF